MLIYKVGGFVRDRVFRDHHNIPIPKSKDRDYAVEADSFLQMKEELLNRGYTIFLESEKHLVIRARQGNQVGDYVLCRKESGYKDGRHPDVVTPGTIDDDLNRRDFTCNAIALLDGSLYDPLGGIDDIKQGRLRAIGGAARSFGDDGLRLLRAIRFYVTHKLVFDEDIARTIKEADSSVLKGVSRDRIREELNKCFSWDTVATLQCLAELKPDLLEAVFPADQSLWLKPTQGKTQAFPKKQK